MEQPTTRISSLDGLRALSIGLVLFGHLSGTRYFPVSFHVGDYFSLASVGVIIFFVISGFLITSLLLNELDHHGRISLKRFYFRRTMRIFPPYYAMILVVIALRALEKIQVSNFDIATSLTYLTNYFRPESWYLGHTWSLSVEEQFYLLWPATLVFLGKRNAFRGAIFLLIFCPLVRVLSLFHIWHSPDSGAFEMVADSLASGCLLALWRGRLHQTPLYLSLLHSRFFFILPLIIFLIGGLHLSSKFYYTAGLTITNWCVTWHQGKVGKMLNSPAIMFIGTMSYSIYLWQQFFLNRVSDKLIASFPMNLFLVFVLALHSFYLVEKPSLRWRQRVENKWAE
jgi:peptidoglycan/LPS O-acetylase OafA/YrhL